MYVSRLYLHYINYIYSILLYLRATKLIVCVDYINIYTLYLHDRYLIGLTDISNDYKLLFVKLLKEAGKFIRQVKTTRESKEVQEELIHLLAQLEVFAHTHTRRHTRTHAHTQIKLPIYWCTITRHILVHMHLFVENFGRFRTINMLSVERFHVLLKGMLTSSKDILKGNISYV